VLDSWDDDELLAALKEAMRAYQAVSPEFLEVGRGAYTCYRIDEELAQLTFDSARDATVSLRSEPASVRALTFTAASAEVTIELEIVEEALIGQIVPMQHGTVEIQALTEATAATPVDDLGVFRICPVPVGPFRLSYRTASGAAVLTGWIAF
jgi:hypothetical protein